MTEQSVVGRRIEKAIKEFSDKDYESCLLQLFPAVDGTGEARRPTSSVGERIREFIHDQQDIITYVAMRGVIKNLNVDGQSLQSVIYKFARNPLSHTGQLDPKLKITENGGLRASEDSWVLSSGFIFGMIIAVITAQENKDSFIITDLEINIFGKKFNINSLWGEEDQFRKTVLPQFNTQ